jgi:predicted DNA-binding protein (MmcQ/YjbR family)
MKSKLRAAPKDRPHIYLTRQGWSVRFMEGLVKQHRCTLTHDTAPAYAMAKRAWVKHVGRLTV